MKTRVSFGLALASSVVTSLTFGDALPSKFDLRNVDGKNFVSTVKNQQGGTCWTHATAASVESNLIVNGNWAAAGDSGIPNLAEYHLDWWNGFNRHYNADIAPRTGGLTVHEGGDYRVATAYLVRGDGMVRDQDGQSYNSAPKQTATSYHAFMPRTVEWHSLVGTREEKIAKIKAALQRGGAVGTALAWTDRLYSSSRNSFYQPPNDGAEPNHAVTLVGWDDDKATQAPTKGAWLVKNSWGTSWGSGGYFWISYADKVSGVHPEMGGVSFEDTELVTHKRVYAHDYHGWRATAEDVNQAFNAFTAQGDETVTHVGFYTATDQVTWAVRVWRTFENGELRNLVSQREGFAEVAGWRSVELNWPVVLRNGEKFYVEVELDKGGFAFDKTSNVPVLLCGPKQRVQVESKAAPGESYWRGGNAWKDFNDREKTGNFGIQAYAE